MTLRVFNYKKLPDDNDAAPPQGAPENNAPSTVNNIQRYQMAAMREFADHLFPLNTTTGTAPGYEVAIGQADLAPQENYLYTIKFHAANNNAVGSTPSLTVNGDSGTTKLIKGINGDNLPPNTIEANTVHTLWYNGSEFRVLTLDEYHEIRREVSGTAYKVSIDEAGNLEYSVGGDVFFRVDKNGNGLFDGDVTAESTSVSSDIRDKREIRDVDVKDMYSIFSYIEPKSFVRDNGRAELGFAAQEVEKAEPRLVAKYMNDKRGETRLGLRAVGLTAVLWATVKYILQRLDKLEAANGSN